MPCAAGCWLCCGAWAHWSTSLPLGDQPLAADYRRRLTFFSIQPVIPGLALHVGAARGSARSRRRLDARWRTAARASSGAAAQEIFSSVEQPDRGAPGRRGCLVCILPHGDRGRPRARVASRRRALLEGVNVGFQYAPPRRAALETPFRSVQWRGMRARQLPEPDGGARQRQQRHGCRSLSIASTARHAQPFCQPRERLEKKTPQLPCLTRVRLLNVCRAPHGAPI